MKPELKNILGELACCLVVVLILALATTSVSSCSKSQASPAPKPVVLAWAAVAGQSMLPAFPALSLVEMEFGVPFTKLKAGDVCFYANSTVPLGVAFHRAIYQLADGSWVMQGDNAVTNPKPDGPTMTVDSYIARGTGRWALVVTAPKVPAIIPEPSVVAAPTMPTMPTVVLPVAVQQSAFDTFPTFASKKKPPVPEPAVYGLVFVGSSVLSVLYLSRRKNAV